MNSILIVYNHPNSKNGVRFALAPPDRPKTAGIWLEPYRNSPNFKNSASESSEEIIRTPKISPVFAGFLPVFIGFYRIGFLVKLISKVRKTLRDISQCWLLWQKVACCMEIVFNMKFFLTQ